MIKWLVKRFLRSKLNDLLEKVDNPGAIAVKGQAILYKLNQVSQFTNDAIEAAKDGNISKEELDNLESRLNALVEELTK